MLEAGYSNCVVVLKINNYKVDLLIACIVLTIFVLITFVTQGDPQMCQFLLKRGVWLVEVDREGRTALHWAILSQNVIIIQNYNNNLL